MDREAFARLSRRELLKLTGGVAAGSMAAFRASPAFAQTPVLYLEDFPTSPLIGGLA